MSTLSFLLSRQAANERIAERKPKFVVHVETHSDWLVADRFIELDAYDIDEAHDLATAWVDHLGNTSAAVRRVVSDGTLHNPCFIK